MSSKRRNSELVKLARTTRVDSSATDEAIFDFLSSLDCPRSLTVWLLYKNKEYQQLVDLDISPGSYFCKFQFRDAYTATSFLSKASFFKLDVSKKDQAYKKFFQYEELCKQTNRRFVNLSLDPNFHGPNVWLLNATTRKIEEILGDFSADEMVEDANWGPGVTTLLKGSHVSAVNKFHLENGITRDLHSFVCTWFTDAYPGWSSHLVKHFGQERFSFQIGNKIVTVPKNSKTDRVIAVEPGINLWFQKGIGTMIRRRLKRWGIDLNTQETNQILAKQASKDGLLATVDFSSASDSISRELVRELLPPRWFAILNCCRAPLGTHGGELVRWEKFSSMGNGFTFELESLIFFAAALAVREFLQVEGRISVFGDDVILPTSCYELFSSFSAFLGFSVNMSKSFSTTYFRESCGSHYFDGVDCKPIFLKERLSNVTSIYKLANGIRWLAHRRNSYYGCDSRFLVPWRRLFRRVPKPLRLQIPLGLGDSGFISNFDESTPAKAGHDIEGYHVSAMVELGLSEHFDGDGLLLARLKAISTLRNGSSIARTSLVRVTYSLNRHPDVWANLMDRASGNTYTLRGRTKLKIVRTLTQRWCNLGPWI